MEKVYRRLERWRKIRRGREPIPKRLWAAAAAVAREHGINPTSKTLHLEFKKLKGFVESERPRKRIVTRTPQFVELMASPTVSECVIELEGRHRKMWRRAKSPFSMAGHFLSTNGAFFVIGEGTALPES